MRILKAIAFLLMAAGAAAAQQPAPAPVIIPSTTFSFNLSAISLPGGGQTTPGTLSGATLNITQNFALRNTDFVGANSTSGYFGGVNYTIAPFSKWLNNISPTLNGYNFQLYLTGSAGVDKVVLPSTTGTHMAFLAGGGLNYAIAGSNTYSLLVEVQYAKLPGLANNTVIVAAGPQVHF